MAERVIKTEEEAKEGRKKTEEIIEIVIKIDITEHKTDTKINVATQSTFNYEKMKRMSSMSLSPSSKLLSFTEIRAMNESVSNKFSVYPPKILYSLNYIKHKNLVK